MSLCVCIQFRCSVYPRVPVSHVGSSFLYYVSLCPVSYVGVILVFLCVLIPCRFGMYLCVPVSYVLVRFCVSMYLSQRLMASFQYVFVISVSMCLLREEGEWVTGWVLVCVRVLPWG